MPGDRLLGACRPAKAAAILTLVAAGWCSIGAVDPAGAASTPSSTVLLSVPLQPGGSGVGRDASVSRDGRFVAFASDSPDLVAHDTNGTGDVFVRDVATRQTRRVTVNAHGGQAQYGGREPAISGDGRYVAFVSDSPDLVPGVIPHSSNVFVRDRIAQTTQLVSFGPGNVVGNDISFLPSISADGRYVAFSSRASNLVSGDSNDMTDVFVRDMQRGRTSRISVDYHGGGSSNGFSSAPRISADGRFVVFTSSADDLVPGDTNTWADVFICDRVRGTTDRVSVSTRGTEGNFSSTAPSVSSDGRFVAFTSSASNLIAHDTNGVDDIFVRDRFTHATSRVSLGAFGQGNGATSGSSTISGDGRFVAFSSLADNLIPRDSNRRADVFVRDVLAGTTRLVSRNEAGGQGNGDSFDGEFSQDGSAVAFQSYSSNLTPDRVTFPYGSAGVYLRQVWP